MKTETAAAELLRHWNHTTRIAGLPEGARPSSRAEGYAIAAAIGTLKGTAVAGWKIAATSTAGQKHINVDGPLAGRIYADRLLSAGARVSLGDNIMRVAEAEFAFSFGKDLPPRASAYNRAEALAAVDGLRLSIEIPDSRYEDFTKVGADQLIADTACASWLVLGEKIASGWQDLDLREHVVTGYRNGTEAARGQGKAVLGDPLDALTWLVNEAATYCGGVKAGQFVTTGTCIVPMAVATGDRIEVDYGVLGKIGAEIA